MKKDILLQAVWLSCVFSVGHAAMPAAASKQTAIDITKSTSVGMQALRNYTTSTNVACFAKAYSAVNEAVAGIGYNQLEELDRLAKQTQEKVAILAQVSKANVWPQFKQVVEHMNIQAEQAAQKKDQRGGLYFAEQYLKQEQDKQDVTPQRKQALQLIQARPYFALDASFKEIMQEAEQDPSKMQAYFSQAKQNTEAMYGVLDAEYKKYEKVHFYDKARKMYGYKVVKKSEKERSESGCVLS